MNTPTLRIARPSDDLAGLLRFYRDGLGLTVLDRFEDHDGFDGMMLGRKGAPYHFEFTKKRDHSGTRIPNEDDLLVFYLPDVADWRAAVQRMRDAGFAPVRSSNPYWDRDGLTFEDPEGDRIVLQNSSWDR